LKEKKLLLSAHLRDLLALNLDNDFSYLIPDLISFSVAMTLAGLRTFARIMFCFAAVAHTKSLGVDLDGLLKRNIHLSPQKRDL
jgi:hypothetical protein